MKMENSQVRTITVPGIPTNSPAAIAIAKDDRPMRVLVDNVGATPMRLSFTSSGLGNVAAQGVDHFDLLVGASRVYVLAPGQRFYAVSIGADGRLSVFTSDALPFNVEGAP
jgi:hypothetical protein